MAKPWPRPSDPRIGIRVAIDAATPLASPVEVVEAAAGVRPRVLRGWLHAAAACRVQWHRVGTVDDPISGEIPVGAGERIAFGFDAMPGDYWECPSAGDPIYLSCTADTQLYGEVYWEDAA